MPRANAVRYPWDTPQLMHCNNLAKFLDGEYTEQEYLKWADYGSYEYMIEMGVDTNV